MLLDGENELQTIDGLLQAARLGLTPIDRPAAERVLRGRRRECGVLDRLLEAVRAGESRVLVVRGEPGMGKSALLEYAVGRASGCRVVRSAGVQSEMELAFAGLHQLCAPMLDRLDRLPDPQREALGTAFGLSAGEAPDRFLVGLAVLSLLGELAEDRPLVCVVDDAQWLDRASVQVLAFVARRVSTGRVAVLLGVREPSEEQELTGLPELLVEGLRDSDARALLGSVMSGPLDERVRDRIVAETRGNPLALLELPRGLSPGELAGGFGLPDALALSGRIEESFQRRLVALPEATRRLLLVAAADPVGEPVLVWRAAEQLGIDAEAAAAPAASAGLAEFGARVRFRHPLVRSAVYQAASLHERQTAHRALAEATDPEVDPDRRAWHRAHAAAGPDEDVAQELERSAGRAQARGGLAAAAAFLERAAVLTIDPARRADRALAAAQAKHEAGAPDAALGLLAAAQAGPLDELQQARVDLLHARIAFAVNRGCDATMLLLKAAKELEPLDLRLARETYLDALSAAMFLGRQGNGDRLLEVAHAALAAGRGSSAPEHPRVADLLLDGLSVLLTEGYPAGTPMLRRALSEFRSGSISKEEELRWLWLACNTADLLWDDESRHVLSARHVELARETGALTVLPMALGMRVGVHLYAGELAEAASLIEEMRAVTEATGTHLAPYAALSLAACQGREAEARELIDASAKDLVARGAGSWPSVVQWPSAVLYNGLGRYDEALAAARQATDNLHACTASLLELIEAASRSGMTDEAVEALRRLSETTQPSGSDWALGIEARSRALLSDGQEAEDLYREAIDRLTRTRMRSELARAYLLYGEWLRRERRRLDAREQLRIAHEMFTAMGAEAFARRAGRELVATGETARKRSVETSDHLTAQESQIARLAGDGLSNPEIGSQLFISPRTVEYHLHKVFGKLNISSRKQLQGVFAADLATGAS
jgi:DNA-binding CsgD family transcriptional regulator/tetratricopeptide (TPR) repeat protein